MTAARLPLQNAVLRDLLTNERLRSLKFESAKLLLKGWCGIGRASASLGRDLFTNELVRRGCGLSLDSFRSFALAARDSRQIAVCVVVGRFTKALLEPGRSVILDPLQSLVAGRRLCLQAILLVIADRFTNELFIRGCVLIVLNVGSRNRAVEYVGWR